MHINPDTVNMIRKLLVCVVHIAACIFITEISSETVGTIVLPQAIVTIIEKSYIGHTTILNFYVSCEDSIRRIRFFYDLVDFTLRKVDNMSVRIGFFEELPTDSQRHSIIVAVDSHPAIDRLFHEIAEMHFNIEGHVLIVLHTFDGHFYESLTKIFEFCWENGMVDVNILVEPIPGVAMMFTYFPYTKSSCAQVQPILCNRFVNAEWENEDLFPLKLVNLQGCSLLCATWENEPYFTILRDDKSHEVYNGIEGKVLEFMASKMNFKIRFKFLNDEQIKRTLEDKGLVFDELFWEGVDFVIGALHYKPTTYEDYFKPTNGYYLSEYTIIISSRRDQIAPIAKLLFPFTADVWLYVLLYFGVGTLVTLGGTWLAEHIRDFILGSMNRTAFWNMYYTALGGGVTRAPKRNFARFLLCTWMILWLVLRSGYQSALFNFIRMDISQPPPEDIDDILRDKYKILLTPPVYKALDKLPHIQAVSQLLNGSEVQNFPMLKGITNEKIAFLVPYEYFGFYKKHHSGEGSEFNVLPEHLFTQQLSMYLRKDSFLVLPFNKYILEYYSNGLVLKWEQAFIERKKRGEKVETPPFKVMTLLEVLGAVDIFLCGTLVSVIVFAGEVIFFKFRKTRRKFLRRLKRRLYYK